LNAKKSETAADSKQTETDIAATEDAMARALSNRDSENVDFKAALKDDIDAVGIRVSAFDALTASSPNNKLPLGNVIQKKTAHGKGDPECRVDPDKAPETFAAPCSGHSSEGDGFTSIMGYIKEDLEDEIKTSKAAEEQRAAALKSLETLNTKKVTFEQQEADPDEKIADAGSETDTMGQIKDRKPRCGWMKDASDARRVMTP
jgi:hypothetical protein